MMKRTEKKTENGLTDTEQRILLINFWDPFLVLGFLMQLAQNMYASIVFWISPMKGVEGFCLRNGFIL
jgi:hypothetical protein